MTRRQRTLVAIATAVVVIGAGVFLGRGWLAGRRAEDWYYQVREEVAVGDLDSAVALAQRAVDAAPNSQWSWCALGYVRLAQRDGPTAEAALRKALDLSPDEPEAHWLLGHALGQRGEWRQAGDEFRQTAAAGHREAAARLELAGAYTHTAQWDDALEEARRVAALEPSWGEAYCAIGYALAAKGDVADGIAQLRKGLELSPDYALGHAILGHSLKRAGQFGEAIGQYQRAIELAPGDAGHAAGFADALLKSGDMVRAAAEYRRASELDPTDRLRINAAFKLLVQLGQVDSAIEFLRGLEGRIPEGLETWLSATVSQGLIFDGDTAEARKRLADLPTSGDTAFAHLRRAECMLYLDEGDAALSESRSAQAASSSGHLGSSVEIAALALSGRLAEADEAIRAEGSTEHGAPTASTIRHAYVLASMGRDRQAQALLTESTKLMDANYPGLDPLYFAGLAYRELGDTERSNELFQRAIDRWPKHPWSEKMREMMGQGSVDRPVP